MGEESCESISEAQTRRNGIPKSAILLLCGPNIGNDKKSAQLSHEDEGTLISLTYFPKDWILT